MMGVPARASRRGSPLAGEFPLSDNEMRLVVAHLARSGFAHASREKNGFARIVHPPAAIAGGRLAFRCGDW